MYPDLLNSGKRVSTAVTEKFGASCLLVISLIIHGYMGTKFTPRPEEYTSSIHSAVL